MTVSRHVAASCRAPLSATGIVSSIHSQTFLSHTEILPAFFKFCGNPRQSVLHLYAPGQCPVDSIRRGISRIQKEKP